MGTSLLVKALPARFHAKYAFVQGLDWSVARSTWLFFIRQALLTLHNRLCISPTIFGDDHSNVTKYSYSIEDFCFVSMI
jgi:hypothetical protein